MVQFCKTGNMDAGVELNVCRAALASLLVAEHVSSLVRFALVPIAHVELSYLFHAGSEKYIKIFQREIF